MTTYARNRRASFNYQLQESFEAGIALKGWEVKGIIAGGVQLVDAHVSIKDGEAWLYGCHITPGPNVDPNTVPDPRRRRKLLLHSAEIDKLDGKVKQTGMAIVAVAMYRKHGKIKLEIALGKGKKVHDKRRALKERDRRRGKAD